MFFKFVVSFGLLTLVKARVLFDYGEVAKNHTHVHQSLFNPANHTLNANLSSSVDDVDEMSRVTPGQICTIYDGTCWLVENVKNCKTDCRWIAFWCRKCPSPDKVTKKACSSGWHNVAGAVCKYISFKNAPSKVVEIIKWFVF